MKKTLLALGVFATISFAQLVDGIAVLVNNLPITLFEIVQTAQTKKVSNEQALDDLIVLKLQAWALERKKITVSDYEVTRQIEKIAASNNMTLTQLKDALKSRYISYDEYKKEIKKDLEKRKLFEQIAQENFTPFDDATLKEYYATHKKDFAEPLKLDVIQYVSKDAKALEAVQASPLTAPPTSVARQEVKIDTQTLDPSLKTMFKMSKGGSFTPILPVKNEFIMFYVKDVLEFATPPFADVRNQVFEAMSLQKQDEAIKEYFEKLKASAQIKIIRLP